jgi:ABC-type bacteriocin/lantibiotic exporter with double-glycine peptidase domain
MRINRRYFKIFKSGSYGRFPVVKQHDRSDCGPAALLSVLRYYNGDSSMARLRELCQTGSEGSTMFDLVEAARRLGFEASGVRGEYSDLLQETMPCIAHVVKDEKFTHYVVIYALNRKHVLLGDPARGLYKLTRVQFLSIWQQKAVILLRPHAAVFKQITPVWFEWLWPYLNHCKSWIAQSVFLGLVYSALSLIMAVFVQKIIDVFIPSADISKITISGILLVFLISLKSVLGYFRQFFLVSLNCKIGLQLNSDFIEHVLHLPRRLLDLYRAGDITSRLYDVMRIQQGVVQIIGITVIDLMILAGSLSLIFAFSARIALITMLAMLVYALFLLLNLKNMNHRQHALLQSFSEVQSTFINTIQGYDEILNYNAAGFFSVKNCLSFSQYQQQLKSLGLLRSKLAGSAEQFGSMMMLALLISGAVWVIREGLLLGQLMACYSLLAGIIPCLNRLVEGSVSWQIMAIAVQRILDLLQMDREKDTGKLICDPVDGIEVRAGGFKWSAGKPLFEDVSLNLQRGKITALWGPIGSGKSTLMQILQRKYLLTSGEIITGDQVSTEFNLHLYREKIGIVPQQVKVFDGTLVENILLGRRFTDREKFKDLMSRYCFDEYVLKFEQGLFTVLGENGRHLSGGELQMLGLVRALLFEPDVLLIDEGFNALDAELEKTVFKLIQQYAQTHLVLISTHNLDMITRVDFVYVLDQGRILQSGTPGDLLIQDGYFRKVWQLWRSSLHRIYSSPAQGAING